MEYVTLSNGVKMPKLGYGVFLVTPEECERCVLDAIDTGYRLIDTAQAYYNEEGVGSAIQKCGVPRDELFLTTKVWIANAGYENAKASIDESLRKLQTDYIDLLLIHQAFGDYYGTWRAMEEAYKSGRLRAVGVSNFYPDRFVDIMHFSDVPPMVNQLETHVFQQQKKAREYVKKYGVQIEAWAPLAQGKNNLFNHPLLSEIGVHYGKTIGQIALRFLIQSSVVVIPKSSRKERMAENIDVFDFALTQDEMNQIEALDSSEDLIMDHQNPELIENFFSRFGIVKKTEAAKK